LWDRFLTHRARIVQSYITRKEGLSSEFFPPYAPELNPTENVWNYLKTNSMANEAIFDLDTLTQKARRHGQALQRKERLLRSFMKHTPLFLRLK
jgi:putative transposase